MRIPNILIPLVIFATPVAALNPETLNGKRVNANSVSEVQSRRDGKTYSGDFYATYNLTFSGTNVTGTVSGYFVFSGNKSITFSRDVSGPIAVPKKGSSDEHILWSIQGNTMTLLRVFDKLGMVMRVAINGPTRCSVQSGIAKQVGAGPVTVPSAYGGTTELLSVRLKSSQCSLQ